MENDLEFKVAGILLDEAANFRRAVELGLKVEDFSCNLPRKIFETIQNLERKRSAYDWNVIAETFLRDGVVDNPIKVFNIYESRPISVNIDFYFEGILERSKKNKLSNAVLQASAAIQSGKPALDVANGLLAATNDLNNSQKFKPQHFIDMVDGFIEYYEGDAQPHKTGLKKIDSLVPYLPSTYNLIGARLGVGKTTFLLNLIEYFSSDYILENFYNKQTRQTESVRKNKPSSKVLFFSLEMDEVQTVARLATQNAPIGTSRILQKKLSDNEADKLMHGLESFGKRAKNNFVFVRSEGINIDEMRNIIFQQTRKNGVDIVVIDYIQIIQSGLNPNINETQKIAHVSQQLKHISLELGICIIGLVQTNRGQMQAADKRPRLNQIGGSDVIARDADSVIFLHRESYENPNAENDYTEAIVAKSRHGDVGTVLMSYNPISNKLEELKE